MNHPTKMIEALLIFQALVSVTSGSTVGVFFVTINSVSNPSGKKADGAYCDSPVPSTTEKCEMILHVCYGTAGSDDSVDSCTSTEEVDDLPANADVIQNIDVGQYPSAAVRINIIDSFPVPVKLKIRVEDRDAGGNELIDNLAKVIEVSHQSPQQVVSLTGSRAEDPVTVTASVVYQCRPGQFGADCATTCRPRLSCEGGFYQCGGEGQKVCTYGFSGPECKTMTTNQCPAYIGASESTWSGSYTCGQTDYDITLKFTSVNQLDVSGQSEMKPAGAAAATDIFPFSGQQNINERSLSLDGSEFTTGSTFTELPGITAVIDGTLMEAKITIGAQCAESSVVLTRTEEKTPSCMYENPTCYRYGQSYSEYACCCRPGFSGARCETPPDLCATHECKNQAECENIPPLFADYRCKCKSGTHGTRCEILSSDVTCANVDPCQNQAVCVNLQTGFHCRCKDGYFGELCTEAVIDTACTADLCKNAGTCEDTTSTDGEATFSCTCPDGFTGVNCELAVAQKPKSLTFVLSTSRTAKLSWDVPDNYNGAIDIYQMLCTVNDSLSQDVLSAPDIVTNVTWTRTTVDLTDLHPVTRYECKVRALVRDSFSEYSDSLFFKTKVEAPGLTDVPRVGYELNTDTTIFLFMPETLSDTGTITKYQIVVHMVTEERTLRKRSVADLVLYERDTLSELDQDMEANLTSYNQAKDAGLTYYISAEFTEKKENFTIGDNELYGGFLNQPLTKGLDYKIYYGVEVEYEGDKAMRYVDIGPTIRAETVTNPEPINQTWLAVGICIALLCIAIIIGVVIFVFLRFRRRTGKGAPLVYEGAEMTHTGDVAGTENPSYSGASTSTPVNEAPAPVEQSELTTRDTADLVATSTSETLPDTNVSSESENSPDPKVSTELENTPDSKVSTESENSPNPKVSTELENTPDSKVSTESENTPDPKVSTGSENAPDSKVSTESETVPEPEVSTDSENTSDLNRSTESEDSTVDENAT